MFKIELILLPFLLSFFISFILTPLTIKFAKHFGLVDDPKKHKHPAMIHKKPIPRAGGIPIYISILIASLLIIPMESIYISILFTGAIVVVVGLLDDKYDLSPYLRFLINILCASIVVFNGANIPFITNPLGGILHFNSFIIANFPIPVSDVLAVIWIVWVMNMLNWSKGVDGQMPGIAAISAIVIGIASLRFLTLEDSNIYTSEMSFMVAGAALGFLIFNFYPGKIHPGYSCTILGFLIGILSILSGVKLATAVLVMGVPMVDAFFTIIRRILAKKSPFWHDKGHLHHLLLNLGLDQRQIALFYWAMSAILGIIALNLSSRGKLFAIILIIVMIIGFILSLKYLIKKRLDDV